MALFASDHHTMWANTAALDAAGILHGHAAPPGSEVVMGADGLATGELREFEGFAPITALTPTGGREMLGLTGHEPTTPPTDAQRNVDKDVMRHALAYCASLGITSFHNMDGNFYQLELLGEIDAGRGADRARSRAVSHGAGPATRRTSKSRLKCGGAGIPIGSRVTSSRYSWTASSSRPLRICSRIIAGCPASEAIPSSGRTSLTPSASRPTSTACRSRCMRSATRQLTGR